MCGIYGSTIPYAESEVASKLHRTSFRGPDYSESEIFVEENYQLTLGHNRLAIIDLDSRSNQPFNYMNLIYIVFNGEIYNFQDLRNTLLQKGYTFKTKGDTEVICAAYLEYGEECPKYLNGMFAFVIFDKKHKILFGARDRLGQKPFYYYHNKTEFEFSSQLSSIQIGHNNLSISNSAIQNYLRWGYIPDPQSIYNEIKKLPPGHAFNYNLSSGVYNQKAYWDLDIKGLSKFEGSYQDAKRDLSTLLDDAVRKRMIADVPLGVFLSGGVDSSLVAALAQKGNSTKIRTFSIKFNTKGYDESGFAQDVANHLKTDHHTIECNYKEGLDLIQNFSHYYDEPFSDSSAIPSMLLAKYTRKHVTVALSGDGGDESFLGYHRYNWVRVAKVFYQLPEFLRPVFVKILFMFPHYRSKVIAEVLKNANINDAYLSMITGAVDEIRNLNNKDISDFYAQYLYHNNKNIYERISDFDIKTYLNGDINTKVDRATMAYSLEARSPFMDYRVVEFARSIPTSFKFTKGNQKRILKDILYDNVPKKIFDRPKAGFAIPLKEWFREDLKGYVLDELDFNGLKALPNIDALEIQKKIQQHMKGSWNRDSLIWRLLVLKQWMNENSEGLTIK
ncbi:asparagine synthase (glutamine-hydrolyzing) [Maribacter aestuarii]|uniref:asparagine synthase (glutamine-hydrolyzing) n=1 Tax=Maribacter aestuarii TaxID=1130723 RepID=UPI00248CD965|nr:asparagine synthase (glutamine-hydrolyzing) [Maribacter aestuarii]